MNDARLPQLVDIKTIAAHLGVPVRHVRQLVADRRIPFHKWGHLIRFDTREVVAWLDHHRVEPAAGTMAGLPRVARSRKGSA